MLESVSVNRKFRLGMLCHLFQTYILNLQWSLSLVKRLGSLGHVKDYFFRRLQDDLVMSDRMLVSRLVARRRDSCLQE